MELRQYAAVIWKWLWLILLATSVAAASTYLAGRSAPPLYQAKTTLMVGQVMQDPDPTNLDIWMGQQLAETYVTLITREPILHAAVEALGLGMSWQSLAERVSAKAVEGTQLLEIQVTDTIPERAQVLADEIAHQLILRSPTTLSEEELERQAFVQTQLGDLEGKIEAAQTQIQELEEDLDVATSARQMQDLRNQIATLQNQVQAWQANYAQLSALLREDRINYLSVVESARLPTAPISSGVMRNVALAAAVGLALAVGAAFLLEYLDDTIRTPDDITQVSNLPTLGAIARIEGQDYPGKLIAMRHPLSPIVEAYRVLRTNLQFSSVDKPARTLMVTSPGPTEGKSVTLANLAVVMAQAGLKVVAVDTDMRRPVLHKIFGLSNSQGLSDAILRPNPGVTEHLQATEVENLWLLSSGPLPPNPAELLGSEVMGSIIEELGEHADVVLFDSPPSLVVADAAILGTRVDGVLMVHDAGRTRRKEARRSVEELERVQANLLGVVLNRLSLRRGGYYYYYRYYYYQSEDGERKRRRHRHHQRSGLGRWLPFLRRRSDEPGGGSNAPDEGA